MVVWLSRNGRLTKPHLQTTDGVQAAAAKVEEDMAYRALEANPMDPEAQRKIEEIINRENVARNMEMAMEEMPEVRVCD